MRRELEEIESIERYLEGKLSGEELENFHAKMEGDAAFRQDVLNQEVVVNRVNHAGKMQALGVAETAFQKKLVMKKWIKTGVITTTVAGAAIAGGNELANSPESQYDPEISVVETMDEEEIPEDTYVSENGFYVEPEDTTKKEKDTSVVEGEVVPESEDPVETPEEDPVDPPNDPDIVETGTENVHIGEENTEAYRMKGTKMFLWSNDRAAKEHFMREMAKYDTWELVHTKAEADYQLNLYEELVMVNWNAWVEITDPETGKVLFHSKSAKGINKSIRKVNVKEQAVYNLVHKVLRYEFDMK